MRALQSRVAAALSILVAASLAGCAAGAGGHSHEHAAMADDQSMCAMHKQMMAGKSPAEQQALEQEHMRGAIPQMRQHMKDMLERCK